MFLLCNGLLVFVAKYSGLIASPKPIEESWSKTHKTFHYRDFDSYDPILCLEYYSVLERKTESFLAKEVNESQVVYETVPPHVDSTEEEDAKDEEIEERDEVEEYDEPSTNNADLEQECDGLEEEEENVGVITEEEMNKKFDEFIRKMKEELRIEAKRHLILV
ncbi:unnamed protein product [Microthlaspi erraticum]|uniref:Uncharacterized protein n=1 Tax=Microthlaspi erraticum TaxID=1685480 RepID=A0A6D2HIW7_9BRAS|nr:unnamed protein product [Microthlaspi erraticum]